MRCEFKYVIFLDKHQLIINEPPIFGKMKNIKNQIAQYRNFNDMEKTEA